MAHRRKSSNPLCKQKRISSVVDRVLAAKLKETEKKNIFYGETQSNDTDTRSFSGSESDGKNKNVLSEKGHGCNIPKDVLPKEKDQNIAIPDDLVGEFQALKKATNLDTATLMRKLIHDYMPERKMASSRLSSQLFDVSIQSSDKDRTGLMDYYENDRSVSPGEIPRLHGRASDTVESNDEEPTPHKSVEVRKNPSPARIYSAEPYYWSDENYPSRHTEHTFSNGYRNSMKVPTVIREQNSDSSSEGQSFVSSNRSRSRENVYSPSVGSEICMQNNDQIVEYSYSAESPELKIPDSYLPRTAIMDDGSVSSAFPLVASLCDENGVIISPKQNEDTLQREHKIDEMKYTQEIISQTDAHMAMQALNPHGITAKLHKASGKSNAKKGQMKLIAENTSHHGVYTSVLKLPWSRRTRTPKNDPAHGVKNNGKSLKQIMQTEDEHLFQDLEAQHEIDQSVVKNEPFEESPGTPKPETPIAPHLQHPVMLVPVTGIQTSQNGIFVPANSIPMTTQAQCNPPMMMVYPNSSFSTVGRPTRKRGRPPKVPVLTRMLSDTSKVPRFDFPVTSFFPQFAPLPHPAIVLNVNNMLNTGGVGNATNNTNANINTSTATNVVESNVLITKEENKNTGSKDETKTTHIMKSDASSTEAQICKATEPKVKKVVSVNEKQSTVIPQPIMTTTASIANIQSGAIYQEMILSSKSLVNVRPRKRQSTTELLKSKSSPSNDFICTSFKLRNVNKPEKEKKKTPWVPGMKRRGRPPKKKIFSMMEGQMEGAVLNPEKSMPATIHHFPPGVTASTVQPPEVYSPIIQAGHHTITTQVTPNTGMVSPNAGMVSPNDSDSKESSSASDPGSSNDENKHTDDEKDESGRDMFQQLFHCKICNEIVPIEKREEHREKHVQIKYCCNKCESVKISYIQRNDLEADECVDKLLKCNECQGADDNTAESSVSLMCSQCNERFLQFSALTSHKYTSHQSSTTKEFICLECDKTFINYQKFKLHQQLCHETRYHSCPYQNCKKVYPELYKLQNHIKKRHESNFHLRCIFDGCTDRFSNHGTLEEHIKSKHYSVKGYTCSKPGCDEEFTSERDLKFHLLLHNDSDMCTFECEVCDYRCHQQHVLDWHMKNLHPETILRNEQLTEDDKNT